MPDDYYRLPLRLDLLLQGPAPARTVMCSLEESLQNHVFLLITTQFREARFDPQYGCTIWDGDFLGTNDANDTRWTEHIETTLRRSIQRYETRLEHPEVRVALDREGSGDAHKRLLVTVRGEIRKSNRRIFEFKRDVMIAPFAPKQR